MNLPSKNTSRSCSRSVGFVNSVFKNVFDEGEVDSIDVIWLVCGCVGHRTDVSQAVFEDQGIIPSSSWEETYQPLVDLSEYLFCPGLH